MAVDTKERCRNETAGAMAEGAFCDGSPFSKMRPAAKARLIKEGVSQIFPRGHVIFVHDDPAQRFFFIKSGWIKLFRETIGGDEAILDVLPPSSVFGDTAFCEGGVYAYGAEVIEDCEIVSYPLSLLEAETQENGDFTIEFLKHVAARGLARDKEIELRSVQNAAQRIGCFILRLCREEKGNQTTLCLPWEKSLIAARLGMAPETFSRGLARLQKDTAMAINGPVIEVPDIKMLARYTCVACSNVFPCKN